MRQRLRVEELEERIAPTIIAVGGAFSWTDSTGDEITISYEDGPEGSFVLALNPLGEDLEAGDDIGTLTFVGASLESRLSITSDGAGSDEIIITEGISAPDQDVGVISLGIEGDAGPAGEVLLGDDFAIDIGGELHFVIINGHFDSDTTGHTINAGGDIGTILIGGNLHLNETTGVANFDAGTDGDGNISFAATFGEIYLGSGTDTLIDGTPFTTSVTIADDAGLGDLGEITLRLTGTATAGEYWAIPVVGGGYVLSEVNVISPNTSLTVTTTGAGGDITSIEFWDDAGNLTISGAPDTDVFRVAGTGSIGTIANRTIGGDIGMVFFGDGDVGAIQTGRLGNLGIVYTGDGNSMPIGDFWEFIPEVGSVVSGRIGAIQVGTIADGDIIAGSIGRITATPGGIYWSDIVVDGDIDLMNVQGIYGARIEAGGSIGRVNVGPGGVYFSEISGLDGITSLSARGIIDGSYIRSFQDNLGTVEGGVIGSLTADAIMRTNVDAAGGIGRVSVRGALLDSNVRSYFWDDNLGDTVGGPIGTVNVGGMYASGIEAHGDINNVRVGAGGVLFDSLIGTMGDLRVLNVLGDVDDSGIFVQGASRVFNVRGDISSNSVVQLVTAGSVNLTGSLIGSELAMGEARSVRIGGGIFNEGELYVDGAVGTVNIAGGISNDGERAIDIYSVNSLNIRGDVYYTDIDIGDAGRIAISGDVIYTDIEVASYTQLMTGSLIDTILTVYEDTGSTRVRGMLAYAEIDLRGSAGRLDVAGSVFESDVIARGEEFGGLSVRGDVFDSDVTLGVYGATATETAALTFNGSLIASDISVYGPLGSLSVRGQINNVDVEASHEIARMTFNSNIMDLDLESESMLGPITVAGSLFDSFIYAEGGLDNVTVRQDIVATALIAENFDGAGDPIAVNMGNISAASMTNAFVRATGDIGDVTVRGTLFNVEIGSVAIDDFGHGDLVGGGSLAGIRAAGILNSDIYVFNNLGHLRVGSYGVDFNSTLTTLDGDFAGIRTTGLVSGRIDVAGNLTGSVLTAGNAALEYQGDYYLTDANGGLTGGLLTVGGSLAPGVVVS